MFSPSWKNPKHRDQSINTLTEYGFPVFGAKRVDLIDSADVLKALSPIWLTKPETARRLRQRIGTMLRWAKAAGHRSGDNPVAGIAKGLPKQTDEETHAPQRSALRRRTDLHHAPAGIGCRPLGEACLQTPDPDHHAHQRGPAGDVGHVRDDFPGRRHSFTPESIAFGWRVGLTGKARDSHACDAASPAFRPESRVDNRFPPIRFLGLPPELPPSVI